MNKREQLKAKILRVAVELFEEKGYINTTTRDIAEKAGIGRGHLYYYFKKKEDIMRELSIIFFKKIYYFTQNNINNTNIKDPYLFYTVVIRCYAYFIMESDYFRRIFIETQDIRSFFTFSCDCFADLFNIHLKQFDISIELDKLRLSVEVNMLILGHLINEKLSDNKDTEIDFICKTAIRHWGYELGLDENKITNIINESKNYVDNMKKDDLFHLIHRSDYEEIMKFI